MSPEYDVPEYDDDTERLFAQLPREGTLPRDGAELIVARLSAEGFFENAQSPVADASGASNYSVRALKTRMLKTRLLKTRLLQSAAALALFAVGGVVGASIVERNSLESQLARTDLSVNDRVLLLQRAGTAYVQAAHAYANATVQTDSTAVEVASQVLVGAAQAVARTSLDAGLSARLTNAIAAPPTSTVPVSNSRKPIIWF